MLKLHEVASKTATRLRQRLARRFPLACQEIPVADGLTIPFTRVADPDLVLDQVADAADRIERTTGKRAEDEQLHLPYWAELWDSAIGIARWMAEGGKAEVRTQKAERRRNAEPVADADVLPSDFRLPTSSPASPASPPPTLLDLGCGMGLTGTVAAALGYDVTFADLETPALLFVRLNSLPYADRVREIRKLNWQTDSLGRRFDVIVGADILYERKQWEFLEPFWRAHLSPGGQVILGEPGRQTGDLFGDWILSRGWRLVRHEIKVETREAPIRIFVIETRMTKPE